MYGNANVYEMRMPTHYVDMSADEMEYSASGFFDGITRSCQNFANKLSRGTNNMIQNWNWNTYTNETLKGASAGGTVGLLVGACTGPGALAGAAAGAMTGASSGAIAYMMSFY